VSGNNVSSATKHDLKAISLSENPKWVKLNYESGEAKEAKGISREWYKGLGGCASEKEAGMSCDEYPFYATKQGGPSETPTPSLEWISTTDNSLQGSYYCLFL
jgi:hypothetical protein